MAKVLVVEDEPSLSADMKQWLIRENYTVEVAEDGRDALDLLRTYHYDVIVLDWELPRMTGLEVLRQFRLARGTTPVLMLTGRAKLDDKEAGLDTGADDYLTKPFEFRELSARLRSLLRRATGEAHNLLVSGSLSVDPKQRRVTSNGRELTLLPKEFALLEFLMRHPGEVFNSEALLLRVWSSESDASQNTVKSYVYTLRKKLASAGNPDVIQTIHAVGYRFVGDECAER